MPDIQYPKLLEGFTGRCFREITGLGKTDTVVLDSLLRAVRETEGEVPSLLKTGNVGGADAGANEAAVCHRIAHHLENQLSKCSSNQLNEMKVDCEYNRDGDATKSVGGSKRKPDIIIHRRGKDGPNELAIEAKYASSYTTRVIFEDVDKLIEHAQTFAYKIMVYLLFDASGTRIFERETITCCPAPSIESIR